MPRHFLYLLSFKISILQAFIFISFSLFQKNSVSHSVNSIMYYHFKAFSYSPDHLSSFVYFAIFIVMNTFIANSLLAPWNIYVDGELRTIIHGCFYESRRITKQIFRRLDQLAFLPARAHAYSVHHPFPSVTHWRDKKASRCLPLHVLLPGALTRISSLGAP